LYKYQALEHKGKNVFSLPKSSLSPASDFLLVGYINTIKLLYPTVDSKTVLGSKSVKEGRDSVKKLTVTQLVSPPQFQPSKLPQNTYHPPSSLLSTSPTHI
jgi:hypothetical protein